MSKKQLTSPHFSLNFRCTEEKAYLLMDMVTPVVSTIDIPGTLDYLERHMPQVLCTKCYNEKNLAFRDEVCETEIGHLFEHILLQELCQLKINRGDNEASHSGRTYWNWEQEKRGRFHITVDINGADVHLLESAIQTAISLTDSLLNHVPNLLTAN